LGLPIPQLGGQYADPSIFSLDDPENFRFVDFGIEEFRQSGSGPRDRRFAHR
jgi:hypothetical protein